MKKILSIIMLLALSSLASADNQKEQAVMKKCAGLGHWSMLRCVELETQGEKDKATAVPMREEYQSFTDLAKASNPDTASKKSIEDGKTVYYQYCFSCHGMDGKGHGPAAEYTGRSIPDLTSANVKKESDGVLYWKTTEGNIPRPMPMFRTFLTKKDIWDMINYIRTLSPEGKK